jgi:3-oxoacid CoA-transferase subunit A
MSAKTQRLRGSTWPENWRSNSTRNARWRNESAPGGAGIPAFFTAAGVGTQIAEGKPTQVFDGRTYVMERGLFADLAVIHAWKSDPEGNLIYRMTARNFNPIMATAAEMVVTEVEELVDLGQIDPDHIITAGIFVNRIVPLASVDKRIEQRTVRKRY